MIIKYYDMNEDLHIIEAATNVRVLSSNHGAFGTSEVCTQVCLDHEHDPDFRFLLSPVDRPVPVPRYILFTADNTEFRLFVYNRAYVCSDEGNTIETVKTKH